MDEFRPFEMKGTPIDEHFRDWSALTIQPYDKEEVDAYSRCRVILMNGIENNAVITSHAIARMSEDDDVRRTLGLIRRVDSQHQQLINWLNPADQTIAETTIGYEQVAVDLTANLAKNEEDDYFRQVLDFALLEDFDHLFRYSCLIDVIGGMDPEKIVQGNTDIKPGRPTAEEHRHPDDEMRKFFDGQSVSAKTMMNYHTIVSAEQQTMLYYKSHGFMHEDDLARGLYTEIAEIEQQHVSQYEAVGDPRETPLAKICMMQLNEAYNYFSCAQTEVDDRLKRLWEELAAEEVMHVQMMVDLIKQKEGRDLREVMELETIAPLIVFESNKEYVDRVLDEQLELRPHQKEFMPMQELPKDWPSFTYMKQVNGDWVPSEEVVGEAMERGRRAA